MEITRRKAIKGASLAALALSSGGLMKAALANATAFDSTDYSEALKLFLADNELSAGDIKIKAPEVAANGATVPIGIASSIENTQSISIFVENNPRPYIATFHINPRIEASVSVRVKMRETSNIVAIAKTDAGYFVAKQSVKVTAGGCV